MKSLILALSACVVAIGCLESVDSQEPDITAKSIATRDEGHAATLSSRVDEAKGGSNEATTPKVAKRTILNDRETFNAWMNQIHIRSGQDACVRVSVPGDGKVFIIAIPGVT